MRQSSVFRSLLDYTCQFTRKINTRHLLVLVRLFHLTGQDPKSAIVNSTLQELRIRLDKDELESNEIVKLLREMNRYLNNSVTINSHFQLNQHFIKICKKKLMKEFSVKDVQLISNCYTTFLNPINDPNYEMINYFNEQLLSSSYQLDFELAIKLLRKIKQTHFDFKQNFRRSDRIVIDEI